MKKSITLSLFTVIFNSVLFSQNISEFENIRNIIVENFNDSESSFPILTNIDNYFIIDNGDYLLSRNNTETEYAILARSSEMIKDFNLKTAIKIGPSSFKRSSAGILIKAQTTGSGALVFEINRKGEFRIKELRNKTYKYLTGKSSNEGWVKNKGIKGEGEFNSIEIRCKDNLYDIYINNKFITNLFSDSFSSGRMGILIGRDAKARVAYYHLDVPAGTKNNLIKEHMNDFNVENLTNRLKQLESEKVTLSNTNIRLEKEVELLKNNNYINITEKELENSNNTIDSLSKIVSELNIDLEVSNNLLSEERKNFIVTNAEVEKGNKMISEFNVKQKEYLSKITLLETELNSKQNRLNNQIELNKELQETNSSLQIKINSKTDKNKVLQSEISNFKNKVSISSKDLIDAEEKIQNFNKELQQTKEEINNYKIKSSNLKDKVTTLNNKISSLNLDIKTINSKLNKEKSNFSKLEKDLKNKINNKTNEITSLNSKLSASKKEISRLNNKYSSCDILINKNTDLNSSINEKDITINNLSSKISELEKSVNDLESKNSLLSKSESNKSEEIDLLTKTVEDLYTKVENMKDVLIYKGFEEKGIQSDKVTTTIVENKKHVSQKSKLDSKKSNNQVADKNITYSVQIATYGSKVTINQFNELKDVFYIDSENGTFLYMSGKFNNSNEAIEHRNRLIKLGYKDAFVVKLNNK